MTHTYSVCTYLVHKTKEFLWISLISFRLCFRYERFRSGRSSAQSVNNGVSQLQPQVVKCPIFAGLPVWNFRATSFVAFSVHFFFSFLCPHLWASVESICMLVLRVRLYSVFHALRCLSSVVVCQLPVSDLLDIHALLNGNPTKTLRYLLSSYAKKLAFVCLFFHINLIVCNTDGAGLLCLSLAHRRLTQTQEEMSPCGPVMCPESVLRSKQYWKPCFCNCVCSGDLMLWTFFFFHLFFYTDAPSLFFFYLTVFVEAILIFIPIL